jgi:hypothetical protein
MVSSGGGELFSLGIADKSRYEELHRAAIGWPLERFNYIGIDDDKDLTEFRAGEVSPLHII